MATRCGQSTTWSPNPAVRRQVAARIDETFVIPADDGMIHHITAQFRPYIRRT
ncbi:hypothetical protein I553_5513 [Mycobacterium xenopi 4042]|uniref:Uncharacterized protein n=1 Tax=Mycobacterium xenopi 4042 TaxID=1299334 RepID=X7ZXW4_MYCXE|nr:hypothetical protein I553_5513 [Mycobacterium xenopi 4042]